MLQAQLRGVRLVFMPLVNPGGMWAHTRANPRGVDLMRNAPQRAESPVPFLAGGQTWSPALPWYCGLPGAPMQMESAALLKLVREQLASRPFSLALDCHSGYGFDDSLWFPYAKTRRLMAHLPEMFTLKTMLEQSMPHHAYRFEPQSNQYLLHGDLWDHAYDLAAPGHVFLPMTLELGSWLWIRKNPRQLLSRHGIFNPIKAHRVQRVLRRHADLLDFLSPRGLCGAGLVAAGRTARPVAATGGRALAPPPHAMNWLLLRGLSREARHWGGFGEQFARALATREGPSPQVVAADLPGTGRWRAARAPASVPATVDSLRAQLRADGHAPPFRVLAMSLGAMVAIDWARRFPDEVAALVLVNTSLAPFSSPVERLRPQNWPQLAGVALQWPLASRAESIEQTIHGLTCARRDAFDHDVAAWARLRREAPVRAGDAARQLLAAARYRTTLRPPCDTLLLSSATDALVAPTCSLRLAAAWQARHRIHPWAGHDLPHDDPDWVCRQVLAWPGSA